MKFVWEVKDILAGRRVEAYNGAEEYMISYRPDVAEDGKCLMLTSLLDGMTNGVWLDEEELVTKLNDGQYRPLHVVVFKKEEENAGEMAKRIFRRRALAERSVA